MRNILFMFLIFVPVLIGISYAGDQITERPNYSAGDYWVFIQEDGKAVKIEFLREEKDQYIFNKEGTQLVNDFNLTSVKDKAHEFPGPIIQFPLKVGKHWRYEYEAESEAIGTKRDTTGRVARYEVEAYEKIKVPAGTFWAFKITVTKETAKRGVFKGSAHYWYSPEVKQIIKSSEEGKVSELKEYKIK